jgi:hypothetical protein
MVTPVWLAAVPTVITTGTLAPVATPAGMVTFTCRSPATSFGDPPAYVTVAGIPPIFAVTVSCGSGSGKLPALIAPVKPAGLVCP